MKSNNVISVNPSATTVSSKAFETTQCVTESETIEATTQKAEPASTKVIKQKSITELKLWQKFTPICQYPELPNGCEITSLTMVLNYLGYHFKKENLSDKYLNKGNVGTVDFREAFEGDPRDNNAYGCYAPVIVDTANKYLSAKGSKLKALEISGTDFNNLFDYTGMGIPVIIWCTYELKPGHYSVTWNVDGKAVTWYTPEHCMVLLGKKDGNAVVADPAFGKIKVYGKSLLEKRYNELFLQAVIIQ